MPFVTGCSEASSEVPSAEAVVAEEEPAAEASSTLVVTLDELTASIKWTRDDGVWEARTGSVDVRVDGGQVTAVLDVVLENGHVTLPIRGEIRGPWTLTCKYGGSETDADGYPELVEDPGLEDDYCANFAAFTSEAGSEQAVLLPRLDL